MPYKGRHDDEDQTCGEAYQKWSAGREERANLFGPFSTGWNDAMLNRSDFARRAYVAGPRREAYMAGRAAERRDAAARELPDVPNSLALTEFVLELAGKLGADVELVAGSITNNARRHEDEPAEHVAWLKRCVATAQENLKEKKRREESPFKVPPGVRA